MIDISVPENHKLLSFLDRPIEPLRVPRQQSSVGRLLRSLFQMAPPFTLVRRSRIVLPPVVSASEAGTVLDQLGAHPDVVRRVWTELAARLPTDCRFVVHSAPALIHPDSGIVFAIVLGTGYALRLPESAIGDAKKLGTPDSVRYSFGGDLEPKRDLGEDWILGFWHSAEYQWCLAAYEFFGRKKGPA